MQVLPSPLPLILQVASNQAARMIFTRYLESSLTSHLPGNFTFKSFNPPHRPPEDMPVSQKSISGHRLLPLVFKEHPDLRIKMEPLWWSGVPSGSLGTLLPIPRSLCLQRLASQTVHVYCLSVASGPIFQPSQRLDCNHTTLSLTLGGPSSSRS